MIKIESDGTAGNINFEEYSSNVLYLIKSYQMHLAFNKAIIKLKL